MAAKCAQLRWDRWYWLHLAVNFSLPLLAVVVFRRPAITPLAALTCRLSGEAK